MRIIIGSDQVGFSLKKAVIDYLKQKNIDVLDVGTFSEEKAVDYPDYAQLTAKKIISGSGDSGILICGTGIGMSIAANKVKGIRAALCHDPYTAHQARAHNNANILCMGAWIVSPQRVGGILDEWLETEYENGRHQPRLLKIENPAVNLDKSEIHNKFNFGVSLSPNPLIFGPLLFAGQLEKGVQEAAENGFDYVEISLRDPSDMSVEYLRSLLSKNGLTLSAIATGQSCLHDAMCFGSTSEEAVKKAISRLKAHIEFASEFRSAVIIGGIRGRLSGSDSEKREQRERAVKAVANCAEKAAELDVQLLIEPINRYETNFINSAEEAVWFIEETGHSELKLLLDTFHMNIEEKDINITLKHYADRIGYIHFADSNRHAPGSGHFPFHQIMSTLIEIDYSGVITAEILPIPNDLKAIQQTGAFLSPYYRHN